MMIVFIVLSIAELLAILFLITKNKKPDKKTIYDAQQNYMQVFHSFLSREYDFEIHARLGNISHTVDSDSLDPSTSAIRLITEMKSLRDNMTGITINILSKMSPEIKKAFYRVYNDDENNDNITEYITRYVFFRIRALTTDISTALQVQQSAISEGGETAQYAQNSKPAQEAVLQQEFKIFENLGITTETKSVKENLQSIAASLAAVNISDNNQKQQQKKGN
jgi:hypothetical protein